MCARSFFIEFSNSYCWLFSFEIFLICRPGWSSICEFTWFSCLSLSSNWCGQHVLSHPACSLSHESHMSVQRTLLWPYETVFRLWVGVVETFLGARRMSELQWQRINEWRSQGLPEAVCPGKAFQNLNWTYKSETVTSGRDQRKMKYRDEGHWHQEPGLYVQKWKQNKTRSTVWGGWEGADELEKELAPIPRSLWSKSWWGPRVYCGFKTWMYLVWLKY